MTQRRASRRKGLLGMVAAIALGLVGSFVPHASSQITQCEMGSELPECQPTGGESVAVCHRNDGEKLVRVIGDGESCAEHETGLVLGEGREGPMGPQGEQGPPGPAGPAGAPGAEGVSGLEFLQRSTPSNSSDFKFIDIACPTGKKVIAGGHQIEDLSGERSPVSVTTSAPTSDRTGWVSRASEVRAYVYSWRLIATAICANS